MIHHIRKFTAYALVGIAGVLFVASDLLCDLAAWAAPDDTDIPKVF